MSVLHTEDFLAESCLQDVRGVEEILQFTGPPRP